MHNHPNSIYVYKESNSSGLGKRIKCEHQKKAKSNHANVASGKQLYIRGNRGYGTGSSPENWKQLMVKLNDQHQATRLLLSQCYLCILNF